MTGYLGSFRTKDGSIRLTTHKNPFYSERRLEAEKKAYNRTVAKRALANEADLELSGGWMKPIMARKPEERPYVFNGREWNTILPINPDDLAIKDDHHYGRIGHFWV